MITTRGSNTWQRRLFVEALESRRTPATFTVITTTDSAGGVGSGQAGDLRYCINTANTAPGADTIAFDSSVFSSAQTITLNGGQLILTSTMYIAGPGANLLTIDANKLSGVFYNNGAVTIDGLTLTNGSAASGGAINNVGTLTLLNSAVSGNSATVGFGGGGIFTFGGTAVLSIINSTLSGNSAGNFGGAIYCASNTKVSLINSTLSGNSAGQGGGIYGNYASIAVINSTINGNSASLGGGIHNRQNSVVGTVTVTSSIVSGNSATIDPDMRVTGGAGVALNFSAVGSNDGFAFTGANNLPFGTNLQLGSLASNGGRTKTIALLAGSPCLDAGSNPQNLNTDQRGTGFFRIGGGKPDIGAFEQKSAPTTITSLQVNDGSAWRSRVNSLIVTFNMPVTLPTNAASAFQLVRQSDNAAVTLNATAVGNSVTLTFAGGAVDSGSLADGRYTLTAIAAQINAGNFDGNGNGYTGDDYVLAGTPANGLFRLFGDADGNGVVNSADFLAFRAAFGGNNSIFDFNNNGSVDASDFLAFRSRFGSSV